MGTYIDSERHTKDSQLLAKAYQFTNFELLRFLGNKSWPDRVERSFRSRFSEQARRQKNSYSQSKLPSFETNQAADAAIDMCKYLETQIPVLPSPLPISSLSEMTSLLYQYTTMFSSDDFDPNVNLPERQSLVSKIPGFIEQLLKWRQIVEPVGPRETALRTGILFGLEGINDPQDRYGRKLNFTDDIQKLIEQSDFPVIREHLLMPENPFLGYLVKNSLEIASNMHKNTTGQDWPYDDDAAVQLTDALIRQITTSIKQHSNLMARDLTLANKYVIRLSRNTSLQNQFMARVSKPPEQLADDLLLSVMGNKTIQIGNYNHEAMFDMFEHLTTLYQLNPSREKSTQILINQLLYFLRGIYRKKIKPDHGYLDGYASLQGLCNALKIDISSVVDDGIIS